MTTPPSNPLTNAKLICRAGVKAALGAMSPHARAEESSLIVKHLANHLAGHVTRQLPGGTAQPPAVMLYCPMPFEPDIAPLAQSLLAQGVRVCVPRVFWESWTMTAAQVRSWPGDLELDAKGLVGPVASAPAVGALALTAVVVPGVSFDLHGRRLGRGGGFYDRFLAAIDPTRRIGVCFACQVVELVPSEPHDEPVGVLVTPAGAHPAQTA